MPQPRAKAISNRLQSNLVQVTAKMNVKCRNCDKSFRKREHLVRHKKTAHTSLKLELVCQKCNKNFAHSKSLEKHLKKGVCQQKQHSCHTCDKRFKSIKNLEKHVVIAHKVDDGEEEEEFKLELDEDESNELLV